ncbi:cyclic nucleotide-binding domain-containing protein [Acidobacteriota bacterium]
MEDAGLANYLKSIPLFKSLTENECMDIVRTIAFDQGNPGDVVCREGEPGTSMVIVERGKVKVTKRTMEGVNEELGQLGPASIIGEMSLLDEQPCSATVTVLETSSLFRIDRAAFNVLRKNLQPAAFKVIRYLAEVLCSRLRDLNYRIEDFFANPEQSIEFLKKREQEIHEGRWGCLHTPPPVQVMEKEDPTATAQDDQAAPGGKEKEIPEFSTRLGPNAEKARIFFFSRIPVFQGMDWKELGILTGVTSEHHYKAGEVIFVERDVGGSLFIVGRGAVGVRKEMGMESTQLLTTVHHGGVFGEVSLVDGKRRSASCHALSEAILFGLNKSDFDELFRTNSPFAFRMIDRIAVVLSQRVRAADISFLRIFSRTGETMKQLKKRIEAIQQTLESGISDEKLMRLVKHRARPSDS